MKTGGHNFHPSRVSGKTKFMRNLEIQKRNKVKKVTIPAIDLSTSDWSTKRKKK